MRRTLYALLLTYWAVCFLWYPQLPERYPIHFNASGEVDGWSAGPAGWFALPLIATAVVLLLIGAGRLARSAPQLWNIPEKQQFLALPAAKRAPIMAVLDQMMDMAAVYTVLVVATCQWAIYRAALSGTPRLPVLFHLVVWGGMAGLLGYMLRTTRNVKQMIQRAAQEASAGHAS